MDYINFVREACKGDAILSILVSILVAGGSILFVSFVMSCYQVVQNFINRRERL